MNTYHGHSVIPDEDVSKAIDSGIIARYPGVCTECRGPIKEGERIRKTPNGGYHHAGACPVPVNGASTRQGDLREHETIDSSNTPLGLPNGVWTIAGPRGHRTYRISTVLPVNRGGIPVGETNNDQDVPFRQRHAGKRVLELLTGPDNTSSYRGLAWYTGKIGNLWAFGKQSEVLVNVFAKLVERGEKLEGYEVKFAKHCWKCNRLLTTPESIERGIGPICASGGWD